MSTPPADGTHDFDFHVGDWTTHLERLDAPLTGSDRWISYDGTTAVRPVWDGRATLVELDVAGAASSICALSLRLYNTSTGQWSLNSSSVGVGTLFPPAFGRFAHGRGEFYGQETFDDRMILVRFVIDDVTETSCRFEQSFSADGGASWELNWVAVDSRTVPTVDEVMPPASAVIVDHPAGVDLEQSQPVIYDRPIGIRLLYRDPSSGAEHYLIRYPAGLLAQRHRHSVAHTIVVLEGRLSANGTVIGPGGYCHFPAGTAMHHASAHGESCLFVTVFDGEFDVHPLDQTT